jgi:uroporphyrinogen decarboxylase
MMKPRERILATLRREPVDRIPVDLWHTPEIGAALRHHFGVADDLAVYRTLGLDKIVWVFADYCHESGQSAGGSPGGDPDDAESRTMWGAPLRSIQAGGAHYTEFASAPLADFNTAASLDDYPWWPRVDRFDYADAAKRAEVAARDFAVIGPWVSLLEIYSQLRGAEQAMIDLIENEELVVATLDRIESIQTEMMRRFFVQSAPHLDLVFVSDDIASQQSLLISPAMWETHLQARLRRWCELVHAHGLRVLYHTDGAARPLLGRILDCGVDVLNPIQHACPGMDRAELRTEFGHRVVFHGGVDNQTVLPRGTREDVRAEVRTCLRTLGAERMGYICCSCHNVQAGTPLENIFAMIETVQAS